MKSIRRLICSGLVLAVLALSTLSPVSASPFGQGVFGADVPFGSVTSLTLALGGNVAFTLVPGSPGEYTGTGAHTLTVTSTDVVGYKLYVWATTSTNLTGVTATIPASGNASPAALAVNTWGYNTDATSNFVGMASTPKLLKDADGPFKNGDNTTVTYGVITSTTKEAGAYQTSVTYTAVPENQ